MLLAPLPPPRRPRLLLRPAAVLAWLVLALAHRAVVLVLWPVGWTSALVLGRVPRWWGWLVPAGRGAAGTPLPRGSVALRALTWPWFGLLRYEAWWFGRLLDLTAWASALVAGRVPARVVRARETARRFGHACERYVLLVGADRPRLPEPDARLRRDRVPGPDVPRLPRWRPSLGWTAIGLDLAIGIGVSTSVAVVALVVSGSESDIPLGAELAADLTIQLGPPAMGLALARRAAPLATWQFGLHVLRPWRSLGAATALVLAYVAVIASLVVAAAPFAAETGDSGIIPVGAGLGWTLAFLALATVVAPVFEELFYRGFVFQALRGRTGTWPAALVSSCAFSLAHLDLNPLALADRALIGVGLCWLLARTGRLLPGIFAHSINNAVVVPVAEGWDWQVPLVVGGSLLVIALLVLPLSRWAGSWTPVPWTDALASRPELPVSGPAGG